MRRRLHVAHIPVSWCIDHLVLPLTQRKYPILIGPHTRLEVASDPYRSICSNKKPKEWEPVWLNTDRNKPNNTRAHQGGDTPITYDMNSDILLPDEQTIPIEQNTDTMKVQIPAAKHHRAMTQIEPRTGPHPGHLRTRE